MSASDLKQIRSEDRCVTELAVKMVKAHFSSAGQTVSKYLESSTSWDGFAFQFATFIGPHLRPEEPAPWVCRLFQDLFQFCAQHPSGPPADRFALILYHVQRPDRVRSLGLPPVPLEECLDMVSAWVDADREREWQQGY